MSTFVSIVGGCQSTTSGALPEPKPDDEEEENDDDIT